MLFRSLPHSPTHVSNLFLLTVSQHSIHVRFSEPPPAPNAPMTKPPVIILHAVGSNSSSWVMLLLMAPQLTQHCQLVLFDSNGDGLSPWSGCDQMTVKDLLNYLPVLLTEFQLKKVAIVAHSPFCMSTSPTIFFFLWCQKMQPHSCPTQSSKACN